MGNMLFYSLVITWHFLELDNCIVSKHFSVKSTSIVFGARSITFCLVEYKGVTIVTKKSLIHVAQQTLT